MLQWYDIQMPDQVTWEWLAKYQARTLLQKKILWSGVCAVVYSIWYAMNTSRIESRVTRPAVLLRQLQQQIKVRVKHVFDGAMKNEEATWLAERSFYQFASV